MLRGTNSIIDLKQRIARYETDLLTSAVTRTAPTHPPITEECNPDEGDPNDAQDDGQDAQDAAEYA